MSHFQRTKPVFVTEYTIGYTGVHEFHFGSDRSEIGVGLKLVRASVLACPCHAASRLVTDCHGSSRRLFLSWCWGSVLLCNISRSLLTLLAALRSTMFGDIRKFQELRPTTVDGHMYTMITPEKAAAMGEASAKHAAGAKVP